MKFTPEDFSKTIDDFGDREFITSSYGDHQELIEIIAAKANEKLQEWLEPAPTLFVWQSLYYDKDGAYWKGSEDLNMVTEGYGTHKGRLICIEEIEK